jgi:hypothetical protein
VQGLKIAGLLEDYARVRFDFLRLPPETEIAKVHQRTDALQAEIWSYLGNLVQDRRDPVASSLLTSLNETFDLATAQRHAFDSGPAAQLVLLLLAMTLASMGGLLPVRFAWATAPNDDPSAAWHVDRRARSHYRSGYAAGGWDPH